MSGLEDLNRLNMFGTIFNKSWQKVGFGIANTNNTGESENVVDTEEFKNIQASCKCDNITFSSIDLNNDGKITQEEWEKMQVKMDLQTVLNQIKSEIARLYTGIDVICQPYVVDVLVDFTENWVSENDGANLNLPNAAEQFRTAIRAKLDEINTGLNSEDGYNIGTAEDPQFIKRPGAAKDQAFDKIFSDIDTTNMSESHIQLLKRRINEKITEYMNSNPYIPEYDPNDTNQTNRLVDPNTVKLEDTVNPAYINAYRNSIIVYVNDYLNNGGLEEIQEQAVAADIAACQADADFANEAVTQINSFNNQTATNGNYLNRTNEEELIEGMEYLNMLLNDPDLANLPEFQSLYAPYKLAYEAYQALTARIQELQQEIQRLLNEATNATDSVHAAECRAEADTLTEELNALMQQWTMLKPQLEYLMQLLKNLYSGIRRTDVTNPICDYAGSSDVRYNSTGHLDYVNTQPADFGNEEDIPDGMREIIDYTNEYVSQELLTRYSSDNPDPSFNYAGLVLIAMQQGVNVAGTAYADLLYTMHSPMTENDKSKLEHLIEWVFCKHNQIMMGTTEVVDLPDDPNSPNVVVALDDPEEPIDPGYWNHTNEPNTPPNGPANPDNPVIPNDPFNPFIPMNPDDDEIPEVAIEFPFNEDIPHQTGGTTNTDTPNPPENPTNPEEPLDIGDSDNSATAAFDDKKPKHDNI